MHVNVCAVLRCRTHCLQKERVKSSRVPRFVSTRCKNSSFPITIVVPRRQSRWVLVFVAHLVEFHVFEIWSGRENNLHVCSSKVAAMGGRPAHRCIISFSRKRSKPRVSPADRNSVSGTRDLFGVDSANLTVPPSSEYFWFVVSPRSPTIRETNCLHTTRLLFKSCSSRSWPPRSSQTPLPGKSVVSCSKGKQRRVNWSMSTKTE